MIGLAAQIVVGSKESGSCYCWGVHPKNSKSFADNKTITIPAKTKLFIIDMFKHEHVHTKEYLTLSSYGFFWVNERNL